MIARQRLGEAEPRCEPSLLLACESIDQQSFLCHTVNSSFDTMIKWDYMSLAQGVGWSSLLQGPLKRQFAPETKGG